MTSQLTDTKDRCGWQLSDCSLQGSTPEYGALNFSNNAPPWEELHRVAEQQAEELDWSRPDLEQVRMRSMSPDDRAICHGPEGKHTPRTMQRCIAW